MRPAQELSRLQVAIVLVVLFLAYCVVGTIDYAALGLPQ
jgi:hypothetical protein